MRAEPQPLARGRDRDVGRQDRHDRGAEDVEVGLDRRRAGRAGRARTAPPRRRARPGAARGRARAPAPAPPASSTSWPSARSALPSRRRATAEPSATSTSMRAQATLRNAGAKLGSRPHPGAHAAIRRVSSTSRSICAISSSTDSKRSSPRRRVEEREPQLAAVEVAVEAEQERLDQQPAAGDERRPHADVGRRRPPAPLAVELDRRAAGVDAVAGIDERRVGHEVGGREAERAAALVAVRDGPAQLERRAEALAGALHHARPRSGRGCASRRRSRRRARPARRRASRTRPGRAAASTSPLARWPKRKFSPTLTRSAPSWPTSTPSMKSCAERLANAPSNGITTSSSTPRPAIRSAFVVERRDQLRRGVGRDDRARVRLERQHRVGAAHDLAVAEVHAVELADRDVARPRARHRGAR